MATHSKVAMDVNFNLGQTLTTQLLPAQPPFANVGKVFSKFESLKLDAAGATHSTFHLTQNESDRAEALGVSGSLDMSYGPVSGDANVKFAMNNSNSMFSMSLIYNVEHTGQSRKMDLSMLSELELTEQAQGEMMGADKQLSDFLAKYGQYMIIGFEYGGRVTFNQTYKCKSAEDKMSVAGGLSVAYNKVPGFSVEGTAEGHYDKSNISKSIDSSFDCYVWPSRGGPEYDALTEAFNELAMGGTSDQDALKAAQKNASLAINTILNPDEDEKDRQLDKVYAIVLPLISIPCVSKGFSDASRVSAQISSFCKFANNLYLNLKSKLLTVQEMSKHWQDPPEVLMRYLTGLSNLTQLMEALEQPEMLMTFAQKYQDFVFGGDDEEESGDQIDIPPKQFYKIYSTALTVEFSNQLLEPYEAMLAAAEPDKVSGCLASGLYTICSGHGKPLAYVKQNQTHLKFLDPEDAVADQLHFDVKLLDNGMYIFHINNSYVTKPDGDRKTILAEEQSWRPLTTLAAWPVKEENEAGSYNKRMLWAISPAMEAGKFLIFEPEFQTFLAPRNDADGTVLLYDQDHGGFVFTPVAPKQ